MSKKTTLLTIEKAQSGPSLANIKDKPNQRYPQADTLPSRC